MLRLRIGFALFALLLLCGRAHAFFMDGCTNGRSNAVTTVTPTGPTANANTGDTLVLIVTSDVAAAPNMTMSGGTGTWNVALANTAFHGTGAKIAIWTHPNYNPGTDTMPTIADGGTSTAYTWENCSYYGVDPTTQIDATPTTQTTASGTTGSCGTQVVNFPTVTPANSNDELLLITGIHAASSPTFSSPSTLTTCSTSSDQNFVDQKTSGVSEINIEQLNQGPCAAAATSAATICSSVVGDNIGVSLPLRSAPFSAVQPVYYSNKFRNLAGVFDDVHQQQTRSTWNLPVYQNSWLDGWTAYTGWANIETNACDEYNWDWMDNMILNARVMGKKVAVGVGSGASLVCGGANSIPCVNLGNPGDMSSLNASTLPNWALTSTTCDGHHAMVSGTDYITSMWTASSSGPPHGNDVIEMDPQSAAYQTEWDRFITAWGARDGGISNIVGVYEQSSSSDSANNSTQTTLDDGADGSTITCSGSALCVNICGANPCNRTLASATQWKSLPPVGGGTYTSANTGGACGSGAANQPWAMCDYTVAEEHFESSWHTAFPNAVVDLIALSSMAPRGTYTGGADQLRANLYPYNLANGVGWIEHQANGLGCANSGCFAGTPPPYIPYTNQPQNGIGWQQVLPQHNVATAPCQANGNYSFSTTNCVPPSTYEAISNSMYPHVEYFLADLQDSASLPWIILQHQFSLALGWSPAGGSASSPTSSFSSELGNSLTQPGTFETGHQ